MKRHPFSIMAIKAAALALAIAGITGCASGSGRGGTASLPLGGVKGRDLGRGEATAGPVSSMDPWSNAADWSVYEAREEAQR